MGQMSLSPARIALCSRVAFVALAFAAAAFAAAAFAAQPAEKTTGHPATPAPVSAAPRGPAASASAGRAIALVNSGFESEKSAPTGGPEGWYSYQHAGDTSYLFVLDDAVKHGGARSLRIDNVGPEPYGSIAQIITGGESIGKTVRFSAWLKTRGADGGGAALFIIAELGGNNVAHNFMAGSEVNGTREWARYSLTLTIPAQADRIRVGTTLEGKGTVWFDDGALEVVNAR